MAARAFVPEHIVPVVSRVEWSKGEAEATCKDDVRQRGVIAVPPPKHGTQILRVSPCHGRPVPFKPANRPLSAYNNTIYHRFTMDRHAA